MEHKFSSTWNSSSEHHADAMVTQRVQLSALGSVSPSIHPSLPPLQLFIHISAMRRTGEELAESLS